jgi:hypothetical protein
VATKQVVQKWMDTLVERLNEVGPVVASDWGGSVQFVFPDLKTGWFLKMAMDGTVESLAEKVDEEHATATVEVDSDTFVGMYEKTISPLEAHTQGLMKARGSIEALVKVIAPTA